MGNYDNNKAKIGILNSFGKNLARRCKSRCELCRANVSLSVFQVPPVAEADIDRCIMICESCLERITKSKDIDANHWYCLNDSAWSEVPAVQVVVWRLLNRLESERWAQDLLEQLYLEDDVIEWAEAEFGKSGTGSKKTIDSNGTVLNDGDSVQIIKDLDVKGVSFVAKRGTIVKDINLTSNPEHIEGRVQKTKLVLKTSFLKKV